jgi:hypothetical protein
MKRKLIQISLVIVICAFTLVFPAYLRCSNLAGAKLLSTDLSFENPDQEDAFFGQQNESKTFVSIVFLIKLPSGTNHFDQISRFCSLTSFLDQKTSILRC